METKAKINHAKKVGNNKRNWTWGGDGRRANERTKMKDTKIIEKMVEKILRVKQF